MPFWWERQLALYILSDFLGIKNPNGLHDLNSPNNLSGVNDSTASFHQKTFNLKKKKFFDGLLLFDREGLTKRS